MPLQVDAPNVVERDQTCDRQPCQTRTLRFAGLLKIVSRLMLETVGSEGSS
jgi:hypothetical protein